MARRPTIADLAEAAGVSVATVDRVLNCRQKVREETARRVLEAAHAIGYHGTSLISQRIRTDLPELRIGVVLHKEKQAFYQDFKRALEAAAMAAPGVRGRVSISFAPSQAPSDFADRMLAFAGKVDAVAATAVTHVDVADAVQTLENEGIPCFSLLNDFGQGVRRSYLGLNNLKVGRIAAHMVATAMHRPGKVAVFVGGHRWHGHELRETGFRSYFREYGPQFQILETLVNLETRQLTYEATLDLLARQPDVRGIYCAGGGMEGAIAALREARTPGQVTLVVNELTPESRSGLADRYLTMVIATPLQRLCSDLFALAAQTRKDADTSLPGQHFIPPDIYLPESI